MEWYWWALIIIAIAAAGYLKLKVFGAIQAKRREKKQRQEEDE